MRQLTAAEFMREHCRPNPFGYKPESGVRHRLYIPYAAGDSKSLLVTVKTHSWNTPSGFDSCICTKGVYAERLHLDGACPICDRVPDARKLAAYLLEMKKGELGEAAYLKAKGELWKSVKLNYPQTSFYMAVVCIESDKLGNPICSSEGTYKFSIQIASLKTKQLEKFTQARQRYDQSDQLGDCEFTVEYPDTTDNIARVMDSVVEMVGDGRRVVVKDSALRGKIDEAFEYFEFIKAVELSRPEVKERSKEDMEAQMNALFSVWDEFKLKRATDPGARYADYGL